MPTISIPPISKNKSHSVMKLDQSNILLIPEDRGSTSKNSIRFHWTELDIPFEWPAFDCTHAVPPDLPSSIHNLFLQWLKARYDFSDDALEVLSLETCICVELAAVWVLDKVRRFAQSMGCDKVNLEALPECILCQEKNVLTLVSDMAHQDSCYSWEILLNELKLGKSSLEALEKGKSIPLTIIKQVQPG